MRPLASVIPKALVLLFITQTQGYFTVFCYFIAEGTFCTDARTTYSICTGTAGAKRI
jgi:hypothetical protein